MLKCANLTLALTAFGILSFFRSTHGNVNAETGDQPTASSLPPSLEECVFRLISPQEAEKESKLASLLDTCVATRQTPDVSRAPKVKQTFTMSDVPRYKTYCQVLLTMLEDPIIGQLTGVAKSLDLRPDRDYFVFFTFQVALDADTALKYFPRHFNLKNTIIVVVDQKSLRVRTVFTICPFCGGYGGHVVTQSESYNALIFPNSLSKYNGKPFVMTSFTTTSFVVELNRQTLDNDSMPPLQLRRGLTKFALDYVQEKYNFSVSIIPTDGPGLKRKDGNWSGVVGDLLKGKADFGAVIVLNYERNQMVSICTPIINIGITFVTGNPKPLYSWRSIYWPLSIECWAWFSIMSIATAITFLLLGKVKTTNEPVKRSTDAFSFLYATLMEQDKCELSSTTETRVLTIFWLFYVILINTAYRTKLVTLLTFPVLQYPPSTFKELAATIPNDYAISQAYFGGAAYRFLQASQSGNLQSIFRRITKYGDHKKCFENSISKQHACITWDAQMEYLFDKHFSGPLGNLPLLKATETLNSVGECFGFPKYSGLKESFDDGLGRAVPMGLVVKWRKIDKSMVSGERQKEKKMLNATESWEIADDDGEPKPIKVEHVLGVFYVIVVGLTISLSVFGVECLQWVRLSPAVKRLRRKVSGGHTWLADKFLELHYQMVISWTKNDRKGEECCRNHRSNERL